MQFGLKCLNASSLLLFTFIPAWAATYEVGPGKPYANIGNVPWESLNPGDRVYIHWRPEPYKEKWVINARGTSSAPITVRGIMNASGQRPVIDGNNATTRPQLNYWNQQRGVIKIGGSNVPADGTPSYIFIENLEIRGARPPYTFTSSTGAVTAYSTNAASIYIEKGERITIRNCVITDSGNGLFIASSDAEAARNIVIEKNHIHGNGNLDSIYHHNVYTEAIGITYQYNRFGPLRAGAKGNNLKDRSAALIVRYNWIEGGNRQMDLVDAEDSVLVRTHSSYDVTKVYGNVLIEPDADGNRQIVHYGGDSGTLSGYRKGVLYFHNNTIISARSDRTTLFRLSTDDERCDARNNIIYSTAPGNTVSMVDGSGILDLWSNWIKAGYVKSFGTVTGAVTERAPMVIGTAPGFVNESAQDFRLAAGSGAIDRGSPLSGLTVTREYIKHQDSIARPAAVLMDLGAFKFGQ